VVPKIRGHATDRFRPERTALKPVSIDTYVHFAAIPTHLRDELLQRHGIG